MLFFPLKGPNYYAATHPGAASLGGVSQTLHAADEPLLYNFLAVSMHAISLPPPCPPMVCLPFCILYLVVHQSAGQGAWMLGDPDWRLPLGRHQGDAAGIRHTLCRVVRQSGQRVPDLPGELALVCSKSIDVMRAIAASFETHGVAANQQYLGH